MNDSTIDMEGTLTIEDMARLLRLSIRLIRQQVKDGKFPIAPMPAIDQRIRWWGPTVRQWCERRADGVPAEGPRDDAAESR